MALEAPEQFCNVPILIIDDVEINHTIMSRQLSKYGLVPFCLNSPSRGLALLRRAREKNIPIPIVVCDYHMAGINGLEFSEIIRNDSRIDGTQIIILTNINLGGLVQKFHELNVLHFLERPCSASDLVTAIKDYVPSGTEVNSSFLNQKQSDFRTSDGSNLPCVLAVDDDATNLVVLEGYLKNAGYSVELAKDGLEALNAFKNHPGNYSLILMDISMPTMNGVNATRHIRALENRKNGLPTPIIAVTAHSHTTQRKIYKDAGMNDVITKPIHKRTFDSMMKKWCPLPHSKALLVNG